MIFKTKTQRRVEKLETELKDLREEFLRLEKLFWIEQYQEFSVFAPKPPAITVKNAVISILAHLGLEVYHNQGTPAFTSIRKKITPSKGNTQPGMESPAGPTPPPKEQP